MYQKLVSIAMCTYNGEKYIEEQIESILNQSYKNLEIIICDDNSTDNTTKLIESYIKVDSRIKIFRNKQNLGFIKNFEKAISLCNGEYIALSDQDDIWKLNKIELYLKKIKDNILIYSDLDMIDENGNLIGKNFARGKDNLCKGKCNLALLYKIFL